jgi:hypothetical protein
MEEYRLQALMDWARTLVSTGEGSKDELDARALLRNSFDLHQHEDLSGDFYHPDFKEPE